MPNPYPIRYLQFHPLGQPTPEGSIALGPLGRPHGVYSVLIERHDHAVCEREIEEHRRRRRST